MTRAPRDGVRLPITTQVWRDVVFLHWPYDPADLAHLAPAGTRLDVRDGVTWLGVVGLRMTRVRIGGVPYGRDFNELNVRLYTVDDEGRRGTVFLAMEAERLPFVVGARTVLRLPYTWSHVGRRREGDTVAHATRRRLPQPAGAGIRFTVRIGAPRRATPTDDFLTARWGLHTPWYGAPLYLPFVHEPWPLHSAELLGLEDEGLLAAAGVPAPGGPPTSVLYAPQVHARSGLPKYAGR